MQHTSECELWKVAKTGEKYFFLMNRVCENFSASWCILVNIYSNNFYVS